MCKTNKMKINELKKTRMSIIDKNNKYGSEQIELRYNDNEKEIAIARFKLDTGQVGLIDINEEYRRKGLGKQIIKEIEDELKEKKIKEIWVVCTKNH